MTQIFLIGLAALLFAVLAALDRRLAVAIFVALLPTYLIRFSVPLVGLPSTMLEVLFAVLLMVWLIQKIRGTDPQKGFDLRPWADGLGFLLVGATFGILIAPDWVAALGLWRAYFLEPYLFFFIFVDTVRDAKSRRLVLAALGSTLAVVGSIAVLQKITGWWIPNPVWVPAEVRRVTAFYGFPNGIGLMAAPITILLVGWTVRTMQKIRRPLDAILPSLTGSTAILGLAAILFAVSEGALIGVAAGLVVLGMLMKPLRKFTLVAIILGCAVVMAYAPLRTYAARMMSMRDDSWHVRKIVWTESLDMLYDRPIWGAGLAGYPSALEPFHQAKHIEIFQYPHSLPLNFWSEVGLIGLGGFLLLVWSYFRVTGRLYLSRPDEWLPAALIAAMVAVLIHGLVDVPYFKNDLALLFFVLLGLAESMRRQHYAVDQPSKS
ncbi:MAG: O-antigen ligase family protein [Patescibacteria group bacterium]